jgi:hypothetical protein
MSGAEVKVAEQIANSQNAFAILFIILFFGVLWGFKQHTQKQDALHVDRQNKIDEIHVESKNDAKDREKALLIIIERQNESLERQNNSLETITETQKLMQGGLEKLEKRVEKLSSHIFYGEKSRRVNVQVQTDE